MARIMKFHCDFCGALVKEADIKVVSGTISGGGIDDRFHQSLAKLNRPELCPDCYNELLSAIACLEDYISRRDRRGKKVDELQKNKEALSA